MELAARHQVSSATILRWALRALAERAKRIGVGPYERAEAHNGRAKNFKPRSFHASGPQP